MTENSQEQTSGGSVPYIFNRDFNSSIRLNYNHWLVTEACGYRLHPKINLPKENLRIADVGTGTGIWLLELSDTCPTTAQLDGFDISPAQFPPKEWLPENVNLFIQDIFKPFPQEMIGTYDMVNLRFALCYVNDEDAEPLLANLISLLKPNGFLQWFETNAYKTKVYQPSGSPPAIGMAQLEKMWHKPKPTSSYK
ncbi:UMTA methyltransferase family protein [Rutstroemia sp. NJR-2017a BBW]|nr:UMTA methyltransferase family protein [Rutstroemia sp. NJR-2017a BBW]